MGLAEWLYHRNERRSKARHVGPAQPADLVFARLDRIESRLRAMGVRVDRLEDPRPKGSTEEGR